MCRQNELYLIEEEEQTCLEASFEAAPLEAHSSEADHSSGARSSGAFEKEAGRNRGSVETVFDP